MSKLHKCLSFFILILLLFCLSSCGLGDDGIDPKTLENLFIKNEALFKEVQAIIEKKLIEQNTNYISINDKLEEYQYGKYRVYLSQVKNEWIEKLTDIFTVDESDKIEKIFKMEFVYIDSTREICRFGEKGFLDCNDEILYTNNLKGLENSIKKDDDEIIKKLNNNWYIYGIR